MAAAAKSLKKAQDMVAKGEKTLNRFSMFGSGSKFEDAAECFDDAGKMFTMAKEFESAGGAYMRAAELHEKTKSEFEAGTSYTRAAEAFQKTDDTPRCVECYKMSVAAYAGLGKCAMAANNSKKVAEIVEGTDDDEAISAYKEAIDYYEAEGRPQAASGCREKVAFLTAAKGDYADAQVAFEDLGKAALQSNLGKFNAKKWFTNAVLCALAKTDTVAAANKLQEYKALDYSFDGTREALLCSSLIAACDDNDDEAIATACAEYDKIKKLDPWMTKILLHIKNSVSPVDDAADDDLPPDEDDAEDLPDLT